MDNVNICSNYHAEDNTCGLDDDACRHTECLFGNYKELPILYEPTVMNDEYGNINWRLAFSMP